MRNIDAKKVRYIKLGPGGAWEKLCLEESALRIGHREVPHNIASTLDRNRIRQHLINGHNVSAGNASGKAREILDFYDDDNQTIWITFANGFLYWCRAEPDVRDLGTNNPTGTKLRRCSSPWSNRSRSGTLLRISDLNGHLTKTAAYRQTICDVAASEYLLAKLNDEILPEVSKAFAAREKMEMALAKLIGMLTWQDFELLVDLTFAASGWRRTGAIGGTQDTVDIELSLPSTGERAFVQVKSATTQAELDDYVGRFKERGEDHMFFAYHTSDKPLVSDSANFFVLDRARLAEMVLDAGLTGWLIKKLA